MRAIVLLLALCACQSIPQSESASLHENLLSAIEFTERDLNEALLRAKGDRAATACYKELLAHVDEMAERNANPVVGVFSAYQTARNARRGLDSVLNEDIHIACAALVSDARNTVLRLVKLLGP